MTLVLDQLALLSRSGQRGYATQQAQRWSDDPKVAFIGHHPTKSHERRGDTHLRRLATSWGRGGYDIGYLYSAIAAHSEELADIDDPIGPGNDAALQELAATHDLVVLVWGSEYLDPARARHVAAMAWRALAATGGSLGILGWDNGQPCAAQHLPADTAMHCLTAGAHPDFCDVDPRWIDLLADAGEDDTALTDLPAGTRRASRNGGMR